MGEIWGCGDAIVRRGAGGVGVGLADAEGPGVDMRSSNAGARSAVLSLLPQCVAPRGKPPLEILSPVVPMMKTSAVDNQLALRPITAWRVVICASARKPRATRQ